MNLRHEITRLRTACAPLAHRLRTACAPLALCAVAALLTVFPLQAQAAKAWTALPSEISVFTGITPTATVTHAGSAFVIYAVISDLDFYIESPDNGPASDQCTYSWSTDSGFVTGGLLCTWALASDAKGLCTCQLIVDDVGAVWPPDTGDRNDKPVTRTFQVGVPTGAIAITKCDASAAGLHEINYTTTTYAATQQNLVLEYRENNSPYTSDWTTITTPPELLSTTTDAHSVVTKTY